jgi:hypothetical protein
LQVGHDKIPAGYNIDVDGDCEKCFMGTVQRYHQDGWDQRLPTCSYHLLAEGFILDNEGNVDLVILKLTGKLSKPLKKLMPYLHKGDEVVVGFEGDANDKTAKFTFKKASEKKLGDHSELLGKFNKSFTDLMNQIDESVQYRQSIAPDFEVFAPTDDTVTLALTDERQATATDLAVTDDDDMPFVCK